MRENEWADTSYIHMYVNMLIPAGRRKMANRMRWGGVSYGTAGFTEV